jgi:hypothetical protein
MFLSALCSNVIIVLTTNMQGVYDEVSLNVLARSTRKDKLDQATIELAADYWVEHSRVSSCKKDIIGSRRKGAMPHAKHFLEMSQTEMFLGFKAKYPNVKIGQRRFESCKPFFVVAARPEDRITCACK